MAQWGRGDDHRGRDPERLLLIPGSRDGQAKKRVPWHQKPHAGCLVLAVLSLFGLGAVLLPSFESPGNITVFRAAEADVRVRQLAGWREDLEAPAPDARHAVTLAIKQDRAAILAALATTSDPDSPQYGQHYTLEEVAAISTPKRSSTNVRAFVEKAADAMGAVSVAWSPGGDFVRLEARVEDLDKIFNAKFRRWERVLRGEVVHETYRTRELAVPKDLEAHLDGFLGALHLPSGQLLRAESDDAGRGLVSEGGPIGGPIGAETSASTIDLERTDSVTDATFGDAYEPASRPLASTTENRGERTATPSLAAGGAADGEPEGGPRGGPSSPFGAARGVAPSAYSDRAPVRIGKPPRRVRVSERDWVLREARALADEAKGGGKDGLNTPKAFRVKVSGNALEDVLVSVPTETGPEASLRMRGERYLEDTPAHRAVDKAVSRARASAQYMYVEKAGPENGEAAIREQRAGEDARGDEASPPRTRRTLAEADEAEDAEDATVDDASSDTSSTSSSSRPASSSAKRAAASKAAERKRRSLEKSARARGELEDKANAMFQKLDDEVREMKTFMAEVVHKDDIGDAESLGGDDESLAEDEEDEEDVPDRSGDREAEGVGSADPDAARTRALNEKGSDKKRRSLEKRRDEEAEDAPLPVVEAGSEAAKRAAKRVSEGGGGGHASGSSAPSTVYVPDDFWSTAPERGGEAASASASASSLPSAPATSDARASDPDAGDAAGDTAEDGDGGGYYEYELNYDAEVAEAEWSEKTYAFEAAEGAFVEREKQTREEEDERNRNRSVFDGESAAERSKRAAQVEERLKALVTPDKVLGYYNVPRAAVVTHPGATLGVAAFAGDATRLRATIWKYAEYFNVSVGAVRAVQQTDAITAEAKRLERLAAESEATTSDVSGTVSGAAGEEAARKPSAERRTPGRRDAASASEDDEASLSRDVSSFEGRDDLNSATEARYSNRASTVSRVGASSSRGGGGADAPPRRVGAKEKRFVSERKKAPSKTEKMEAAAQSAVASAVSGAVDAAVDAADKFAEGVGLAVEKGDRRVTESERAARGAASADAKQGASANSKNSAHGSDGIQIFAADGDLRLAFRGDAEVASFAASDVSDVSDVEMKMDPSEPIEAFSETDVSAQTAGSYPPRLAAAEVAGTSSASSSAHAAAATGSSAPLTAADLGWNDLASSRLESNLDVQAATATARGGAVDLFLASPSQHYGWEALDVVLSLAARRDPPSVLSLSFGGAERPRAGVSGDLGPDDREARESDESADKKAAAARGDATRVSETGDAADTRQPGSDSAPDSSGPRLGAFANSTVDTVGEERGSFVKRGDASSENEEKTTVSVPGFASASARGIEDANKPRPSYVKQVNAWDTFERVDTEFAKLGLRGVTVVAASGDNGPFSFGIPNPYQSWSSPDTPCSFQPSFPGSMPHVVAVGGTTGGKDPFKPERAAAVESGGKITTGGGFSDVFPQPEWQKLAVQRYLKQHAYDLPPESFFNASNRGYPDVALAAEDIAVVFAAFGAEDAGAEDSSAGSARAQKTLGTHSPDESSRPSVDDALARRARHYLTESSGTSYAAPLFAGMMALVNDERLALNKTTVGFVSPALYALHRSDGAESVFNDIKEGSSKCPNAKMCGAMVGCCKHGFRAGKGWDPLTGLGSVDFQRLRDELVRLP